MHITKYIFVGISLLMIADSTYAGFKRKKKAGKFVPLKNIECDWPHDLVKKCATVRLMVKNPNNSMAYGWEFKRNLGDVFVQINGGKTEYIDPYGNRLPAGYFYCKKAESASKVQITTADTDEGFYTYQGSDKPLTQRYKCEDSGEYWQLKPLEQSKS